jgi:three-Cys-motif partner protein
MKRDALLNALDIDPPFRKYHSVDLEKSKTEALREVVGDHEDVFIWNEDCNEVLLKTVFPKVRYDGFRRALCLLDPYGLDLKWRVISKVGAMKTIEIFRNFPVMDINRNVFWTDHEKVDPVQRDRMDSFWGDLSWHQAAYEVSQLGLFGDRPEKTSNEACREDLGKHLGSSRILKEITGVGPSRQSRGDPS